MKLQSCNDLPKATEWPSWDSESLSLAWALCPSQHVVLPPRPSGKTLFLWGVFWGPTWSDCHGGHGELLLFFLFLDTSQQALWD